MPSQTKSRRKTKLLGGYVPPQVFAAVERWVSNGTERDQSQFVREAVREKLRRDGIKVKEST